MGQLFHACAYDIKEKTRCVMDTDKFHANCYSYSGAVQSIHYLLRQKPYNIMWGGGYIVLDDFLENIDDENLLYGFSTYRCYEHFERNNKDLEEKSYCEKVKKIDEYNKMWTKIDVWDEAIEFFKKDKNKLYSGYLLNHTQKLAVNLSDFYEKSKSMRQSRKGDIEMVIDPIAVLAETGGGSEMAFFDGIDINTTEDLAGTWCGELLEISDKLPENYEIINCCFAEINSRAYYLFQTFGVNADNRLLKDADGNLFEVTELDLFDKRSKSCNLKAEITETGVTIKAVETDEK